MADQCSLALTWSCVFMPSITSSVILDRELQPAPPATTSSLWSPMLALFRSTFTHCSYRAETPTWRQERLDVGEHCFQLTTTQTSSAIPDPQYHASATSPRAGSAPALADALLHTLHPDQEQVYNGRQGPWCLQRLQNGPSMPWPSLRATQG